MSKSLFKISEQKQNQKPLSIESSASANSTCSTQISNRGFWSGKQTLKYNLFVYHNRDKFLTKSSRKSSMIFKQMAKFIKTRNVNQCRTHHLTVLKKNMGSQNSLTLFLQKNSNFMRIYELTKPKLIQFENYELIQDNSRINTKISLKQIQKEQGGSENEKKSMDSKNEIPEQILIEETNSDALNLLQIRKVKLLQCALYFNLWIGKLQRLIENKN